MADDIAQRTQAPPPYWSPVATASSQAGTRGGLVAQRQLDAQRCARTGRARQNHRPSDRLDAVSRPSSPEPSYGSAPPRPSSRTSTRRAPPSTATAVLREPGRIAKVVDSKRVAADHYIYALTDYREVDRTIAVARIVG
jgi:hypothetical protein